MHLMKDIPRGAAVLLMSQVTGQLWLCRRAATLPQYPRKWQGAGGKVEPGERDVDAAVRELKEEAGLVAKPEDLTFVRYCYMHHPDGQPYTMALFSMLTGIPPRQMEPDKAGPYRLFSLADLVRIRGQLMPALRAWLEATHLLQHGI